MANFSNAPESRGQVKSANKPYFSKWDKAKYRITSLAKEMRPHPIRRWKQTDAQVKNLFAGAAIAAPGFIALLGGGIGAANSQDILNECRNRPAETALPSEICDDVKGTRNSQIAISVVGGAEMVLVGGLTAANHRRLGKKRDGGNLPGFSTRSVSPTPFHGPVAR